MIRCTHFQTPEQRELALSGDPICGDTDRLISYQLITTIFLISLIALIIIYYQIRFRF